MSIKNINFTGWTGGFPLTAERLDDMQSSYNAIGQYLGQLGQLSTLAANTPVAVSGMLINSAGVVSSGILWYNGELVPFTGSTISTSNYSGTAVVITTSTTSLNYLDTNVHPAISTKAAALVYQGGTPATNADQFPYAILNPLARPRYFNHIAVAGVGSGVVVGDIYWKWNAMNNTLHLKGSLTATESTGVAGSPIYETMGTISIPVMVNDLGSYCFNVQLTSGYFVDSGGNKVYRLNGEIDAAGNIKIMFQKSDLMVTSYSVYFNTIIPFDQVSDPI